MRRLWLILGSVFTVVVLAGGGYSAVNALAREEVGVHDVVAASGIVEVVVDTSNGSVEAIGDPDATEIRIDATVRHGLRRTEYSVARRADRLVIDGDCNNLVAFWCRVDVTITMPADLPLDIRSHNGRIDVSHIDAGVVAHTSNGSIDLIGVRGNVDARTSNGAVRGHGLAGDSVNAESSNGSIELTFSSPPRHVDASTSNGSIEIIVPDDDTAYAVDVNTSSHSSTEVTVRTDPSSDRTITADTSNGSISVFYPTS